MKKNTFIILSIFILCYVIQGAQINNVPAINTSASIDEQPLMLGGDTVGIKLYSEGVVCVNFEEINSRCPAKEAGLCTGDVIYSVNKNAVIDNQSLADAIETNCEKYEIVYKRNGEEKSATVYPVTGTDGKNKIGLWVRDGVAGVGTVTFYDKSTNRVALLGHAVTDVDTQKPFLIRKGVITNCDIVSINKGTSGAPGEICGRFTDNEVVIGTLSDNLSCGLFADAKNASTFTKEIYPASRDMIKKGKAYLISDIEGVKKSYEIEIERIMLGGVMTNHDMQIRVTDKRLLDLTGGIVQGMSGSPIVQNGRLVGAVTHVFINEPERGYAISIGKILKENRKK